MKDWEREEESKKRDRENDLNKEKIKALGRASDKNSDQEGFSQINKATDIALKQNELNFKSEVAQREFQLKEARNEQDMKLKMEKLKLDAKKLQEKVLDRKSKEYIATINKN